MVSPQTKDYFKKRLEEKLKKNPNIKMDDLGLYINILGVREVQDAKRRNKRKVD